MKLPNRVAGRISLPAPTPPVMRVRGIKPWGQAIVQMTKRAPSASRTLLEKQGLRLLSQEEMLKL
jgi:hypothetical protein